MKTRVVEVTNSKGGTKRYIFEEGLRYSLDEHNVLTVRDPDDDTFDVNIADAAGVRFYPPADDAGADHLVVVSDKSRKAKEKRKPPEESPEPA